MEFSVPLLFYSDSMSAVVIPQVQYIPLIELWGVSNSSNLGKFYGWPDFFGGKELKPVTDPMFKSPRGKQPLQFLMQDHPPVEKPLADIGHAVGSTQVAISNSSAFGLEGMEFIGQFGTTYPSSHTHFELLDFIIKNYYEQASN